MIDVGVPAPSFELPALVDGDHRRVSLDEYLGEDVVILAFYPGDFNPACDEESDLDELDLFTMQKDVTVLGIGPDTLYAHEAFADAYDLHIPLLSDTRREVAEQYGVTFEGENGQDLLERAVFVVDHDGEITYAWSTRDVEALPVTEEIKEAIGETGGDETAFARYRVGHAHYVEGRRAFTSAMQSFGDSEWMLAQSDFQRAREEFTEADEHFDSAVRFVDDDRYGAHYAAAEEKATYLWQAADWLAQSASHYSSGRGADGQQLRDDAETPIEEARAIAEPIDPDDWPPDGPPEREEPGEDAETFVPDDEGERPAASLEVDIDEESADGATDEAGGDETTDESDTAGDIDDEELAEIEAELAEAPSDDPVDAPPAERRSVIDGAPETADEEHDEGTADAAGAGDVDDTGDADDENGETAEITDDELAEIGAEIAASDPANGEEDVGDESGEEADDEPGDGEDDDATDEADDDATDEADDDATDEADDDATDEADDDATDRADDDASDEADDEASDRADDDATDESDDEPEANDGAEYPSTEGADDHRAPGSENRPI